MLMQGSLGAQVANLIALLLTAIGNTAANRRFTFGIGGSGSTWPVITSKVSSCSAIALAITSGSFWPYLHLIVVRPTPL